MKDRSEPTRAYTGPGLIRKAATLEAQEATEAELRQINKYTLAPLSAEDVFVFAAVLCDNDLDRHFEHFTLKALQDLQGLFVGKTVIKDHYASADNQVARIYDTELVETGRTLANGEPYTQLKAHCYMVRTAANADLITEIMAGIKKEGSVGCRVASVICSICGTDNAKTYCRHWPGRTYDKEGGKTLCTFKLDGATDAYEFSFVAVPAQREAGVGKAYTGEPMTEPPADPEPTEAEEPTTNTDDRERALRLRARANINL